MRILGKPRSRITVEGLDRAPHRAFLRALGVSDADLAKPFIGVASTDGRVTPCNALLGEFAREACAAVRAAGGVPFDFASISVADSMSMGHGGMRYSLLSREIIADGVEIGRAHVNSSHITISYAVFCLKKKKQTSKITFIIKKEMNKVKKRSVA